MKVISKILAVFGLMGFLVVPIYPVLAASPLLTGMQLAANMDGNSNDGLGNFNGVDTSVSYVTGKIKQAGSYSAGSGSNTVFGSGIPYSGSNPPHSLMVWFNTTETTSAAALLTVGIPSGGGDGLFLLVGKPFYISNFGQKQVGSTQTGLNDGNWHLFIFTWDGTTPHVYVDGTEGTSITLNSSYVTFSGGSIDAAKDVTSTGATQYTGLLDMIYIWNVALTSDNVTTLWNAGAGVQYPFSASIYNLIMGIVF